MAYLKANTLSAYLQPSMTATIHPREYGDMTEEGVQLLETIKQKVANNEGTRTVANGRLEISRSSVWMPNKSSPYYEANSKYSSMCTWNNRVLIWEAAPDVFMQSSPIVFYQTPEDGKPGWAYTSSDTLYIF